jgi:hypothetical protein
VQPFGEFRTWARAAPGVERSLSILAGLVLAALLGWLLVPGGGDAGSGTITAGAAAATTATIAGGAANGGPAASAAGSTGGVGGATAAAATPASSSGAPVAASAAGTATAAGGCTPPPSSAQGVTAKEIKVAVVLVNIFGPAGNDTFGTPPPEEVQTDFEAVVDSVNKAGGVGCRKLVPTYYKANPADKSNLEATCRDIADAKVFAVIDQGSFADYPQVSCFPRQKLPYFGSYIMSRDDALAGYPYLFNFQTFEPLYRNTIFALRDRGFFSPANGFQKLGFVYRSCQAKVIADIRDWIRQAGVPDDKIVTYDVGCPDVFASPSDLQQAVLKFRTQGVTHVTTARFVGDFPNFSTIAEQQGFRPKYGFGDDLIVTTTYGSLHPDFKNLDGAVAITQSRIGEERTPGLPLAPGTVKCDAIYKAHGRPPVYQQRLGGGGRPCNDIWYFKAAVENAPALRQDTLAAGLRKARSVEFSWPEGPNDFSGDRVTWGGQLWRPVQFTTQCNCWRVIDPNFKPSYP